MREALCMFFVRWQLFPIFSHEIYSGQCTLRMASFSEVEYRAVLSVLTRTASSA